MPKREVFYGALSWRDLKFDVVAARKWLGAVEAEDPDLLAMLSKVAAGEYMNINNKITDFVIELQRSKHSDNDAAMAEFFGKLIEDLIERLNLEMITREALMHLRKNDRLIHFPEIRAEIERIIRNRNNALSPK